MEYREGVLPIIRETREIVLPHWGTAATERKTVNPADVVTELDTAVEQHLRERLAERYPDIGFVGEEFGGDKTAKMFWLVDPIDGTAHFARGLPFCTTMLALVKDEQVIFSAVYHFLTDDMYWAERGKGAYKNDERIYVSDREPADAYVYNETLMAKEVNQKMFVALALSGVRLTNTVSAGWEFSMIASGKAEARVGFDPWGKDYDFAPGSLLVSEAGGAVTNLGPASYNFRNRCHIMGNKRVHATLAELFKDYPITESYN